MELYEIYHEGWDEHYTYGYTTNKEQAEIVKNIFKASINTINIDEESAVVSKFCSLVSKGDKGYIVTYNMRKGKIKKIESMTPLLRWSGALHMSEALTQSGYDLLINVYAKDKEEAKKKALPVAEFVTEAIKDKYEPTSDEVIYYKNFHTNEIVVHDFRDAQNQKHTQLSLYQG